MSITGMGSIGTLGGSVANSTSSASTGATSGFSAGAALSIVGSVLEIGSSIYGISLNSKVSKANANLAQAQGNYSSAVAEFNAAVARANALAIRESANLDIERQKVAATKLKSGQIAGYSKAGVKLQGSPLNVMIDSAMNAKLDIALTDYNAKVGIMRANSQASGYDKSSVLAKSTGDATSSMLKSSAKNATMQGISKALSGSTSLLSTVASYSR